MNTLIATDKKIVIYGLGMTGLSVARYLKKKAQAFCVVDTRAEPPGLAELKEIDSAVPVYAGEITPEVTELLTTVDEIVLSPGVARANAEIKLAENAGVKITSDIEIFLSNAHAPVVGITGSNGKTTVTTLVGKVAEAAGLQVQVAGNIGIPALDVLNETVELYVLELSSFQLETIAKPSLDVACVLNISEDHMDRYDSLQSYCMAKQRIFFAAKNVIYNLDDLLTQPPIVGGVNRFGFGLKPHQEGGETKYAYDAARQRLTRNGETLTKKADICMVGDHNIANALAVFAIADAVGIKCDVVADVLTTFAGLPHRCQRVAERAGLVFVNDSKATNVGATTAAIEGLASGYPAVTLIAGGEGKGADFSELAKIIANKVSLLILIGRDASRIEQHLDSGTRSVKAESLNAAVAAAIELSAAGSLVLLSPACASFDMFRNYEDRGEQFIAAVEGVAA